MAKIGLTKITPIKDKGVKTFQIDDINVEVIQYLPMEEKSKLLLDVLNYVLDTNGLSSPLREEIYTTLFIIKYYTNINLTETMINNGAKTYDLLVLNEITKKVYDLIPEDELNYIFDMTHDAIVDSMTYRMSMAGMIENASTAQGSELKDIDAITEQLRKISDSEMLRDVLNKLS